jgi:hypothetical protein
MRLSNLLLEHVFPVSAQTYDDDDEQGSDHVHPDVGQVVDVYLGVWEAAHRLPTDGPVNRHTSLSWYSLEKKVLLHI